MTVRRNRRWNYLSDEYVRNVAQTATTESAWNDDLTHPMLVSTDRMAGKNITITFDDGAVWKYEFIDERHLRWEYGDGMKGEDIYNAAPAPGFDDILFVHHYRAGQDLPRCTDMIVELDTGFVTAIDAKIGNPTAPREVVRNFRFGSIDGIEAPAGAVKPDYTKELIGKAVYWRHPDTNSRRGIKYIFSSNLYYTYVMHQNEAGTCWMATHPCDYIKIRDDLYLMSPIEERQTGMQLVMLMNLDIMRDIQTGFGMGFLNDEIDRLESWMRSGRVGEWTVMETCFD